MGLAHEYALDADGPKRLRVTQLDGDRYSVSLDGADCARSPASPASANGHAPRRQRPRLRVAPGHVRLGRRLAHHARRRTAAGHHRRSRRDRASRVGGALRRRHPHRRGRRPRAHLVGFMRTIGGSPWSLSTRDSRSPAARAPLGSALLSAWRLRGTSRLRRDASRPHGDAPRRHSSACALRADARRPRALEPPATSTARAAAAAS